MGKQKSYRWVFGLFCLAGCSSTVAYQGPQRPPSEISKVYYHSFNSLTLYSMSVDGVEQGLFNTGLEVAPGAHKFRVNYQFDDSDCSKPYGCLGNSYSGECWGEFATEPGRAYRIDISATGSGASTSVSYDGEYDVLAVGECNGGY